jgi:hypothetical protein
MHAQSLIALMFCQLLLLPPPQAALEAFRAVFKP